MQDEAKACDFDALSAAANDIAAEYGTVPVSDEYDPRSLFGEAWISDGLGGYMSVPITVILQIRKCIEGRKVIITSRVFFPYCLGSHIHSPEAGIYSANCLGGDHYFVMEPEDRTIHSAPFPRLPWGLPETPGYRRPRSTRRAA